MEKENLKRSGNAKKKRMSKRQAEIRRRKLLMKKSAKYRRYRRALMIRRTIAAAIVLVLLCSIGALGKTISNKREEKRQRELQAKLEAEELERQKALEVEPEDITIGSTGCMLLHGPILNSECYSEGDAVSERERHYDFSDIYKYITPKYSEPDFMVCEFEGTLTGEDYSGYPCFHSPDVIIQNIADSGVDLQLLATNHMYDGLSDAFRRTMRVYEEKGLNYTGARSSESMKKYFVADIKGVKVGFVNYVYETEDGDVELNGIAVSKEDQPLLNSMDYYNDLDKFYGEMKENVEAMKADGVQFVIANLHWGDEYQLKEAEYQRKIAQKLCDMGVDAIIGGHPHCEQPIDMLESANGHRMFCIYSVGNALTNQRKALISDMPEGHTEDGVMVTLTLHRDKNNQVTLKDVSLLPTWVYLDYADMGNLYYILPLDDVDNLEAKTGLSGVREEAAASYKRTMDELGPGLEKVRNMLAESVKTENTDENTAENTAENAEETVSEENEENTSV